MNCAGILIVEDEKDIRDTLKQVLELEGYQPATACNGAEAIEYLKKNNPPCLILLDLMMPVMNGWEFIQAQKENVAIATIPVVVISAAGERRNPRAAAFIKKPVDIELLLSFVRRFCCHPAAQPAY